MLDIAIRGATIYDGLRETPFVGDLGLEGDRIVEIGDAVGRAQLDIDAEELVAAPGFVDAHTHDDVHLHAEPTNRNKIQQGVTTVVCGSCGFSAFPHEPGSPAPDLLRTDGPWRSLEGWAETLSRRGVATNFATFVGHNTLTRIANEGASASRLSHIAGEIRRAMEAGALGMSTGLIYEPGKWADRDLLVDLTRVVADYGGLYSTHVRDEGSGLLAAIDEAVDICTATGVGLQISHLKVIGANNFGTIGDALARIDRAAAEGLDVGFDAYPYTAGSGPFSTYFRLGDVDEERASLVQLVHVPSRPKLEGRLLRDVALERGITVPALVDELLALPRRHEIICVIFEIDEDDMRAVLRHPRVMIGSDGLPGIPGVPHPRLTDTFVRMLGTYVRDLGVLELGEAIKKMTSIPADRYGLSDRGRLEVGAHADIVVFSEQNVMGNSTFVAQSPPSGIDTVIVNGQVVVRRGGNHDQSVLPGKFLIGPGGT